MIRKDNRVSADGRIKDGTYTMDLIDWLWTEVMMKEWFPGLIAEGSTVIACPGSRKEEELRKTEQEEQQSDR